jgi:hypothetical protein
LKQGIEKVPGKVVKFVKRVRWGWWWGVDHQRQPRQQQRQQWQQLLQQTEGWRWHLYGGSCPAAA